MIILAAGEIFGKIREFYKKVLEVENKLDKKCDWILQTGNFGVFPGKNKIESEFGEIYSKNKRMPRQTLFVAGKYEDHDFLEMKLQNGELEILGNLNWLINGNKTFIGDNYNQVSVCGLGKVFSPTSYSSGINNKKSKGHYRKAEVNIACTNGPTDILLTSQAGHGERIGTYVSDSEGINKVSYAIRPKLHIHGGYNISSEYVNKLGVMTISLAHQEIKAIEWENRQFRLLGSF